MSFLRFVGDVIHVKYKSIDMNIASKASVISRYSPYRRQRRKDREAPSQPKRITMLTFFWTEYDMFKGLSNSSLRLRTRS